MFVTSWTGRQPTLIAVARVLPVSYARCTSPRRLGSRRASPAHRSSPASRRPAGRSRRCRLGSTAVGLTSTAATPPRLGRLRQPPAPAPRCGRPVTPASTMRSSTTVEDLSASAWIEFTRYSPNQCRDTVTSTAQTSSNLSLCTSTGGDFFAGVVTRVPAPCSEGPLFGL